jgi:SAM-dependent methyltransferase
MHHEILHFVYETKNLYPEYFAKTRVLEIGSLKLGKQPSVRCHFDNCDYTGVDISEGPCVDVVCRGHEYKSNQLFDIVISCECFEHDPFYDLTVTNMINLLRPNGLLIFTCASTGRPEHGTRSSNPESSPFTSQIETWQDYYRNLTEFDFKKIPSFSNMKGNYWVSNEASKDLYYRGWKK